MAKAFGVVMKSTITVGTTIQTGCTAAADCSQAGVRWESTGWGGEGGGEQDVLSTGLSLLVDVVAWKSWIEPNNCCWVNYVNIQVLTVVLHENISLIRCSGQNSEKHHIAYSM